MAMLLQISLTYYLPSGISDHAPLIVIITQNIKGPAKRWKLNPVRLDVAHLESNCTLAMEEYWRVNGGTSSPLIEWDAFKAVMRGAMIQVIASHRAELREALEKH